MALLFTGLAAYVTGDATVSAWLVAGGVVVCGLLALGFAAALAALARLRPPAHLAAAGAGTLALGATAALAARRAPAATPLALLVLAVWVVLSLGPQRWRLWLLMAGRNLDLLVVGWSDADAKRVERVHKLAGQATGEFYLVRESSVVPVRSDESLVRTEQLPEEQIARLARLTV